MLDPARPPPGPGPGVVAAGGHREDLPVRPMVALMGLEQVQQIVAQAAASVLGTDSEGAQMTSLIVCPPGPQMLLCAFEDDFPDDFPRDLLLPHGNSPLQCEKESIFL